MKRTSVVLALALSFLSNACFAEDDFGFPAINTLGRYLGVGWSYHTYHSRVDGRIKAITNRHPAEAYPSSSLSYMYAPGYTNYPPAANKPQPFWNAPVVQNIQPVNPLSQPISQGSMVPEVARPSNLPKRAPEEKQIEELRPPASVKPQVPAKPQEPPPGWLKPYLDGDKSKSDGSLIELEPSPSDAKSTQLPQNTYRSPRR